MANESEAAGNGQDHNQSRVQELIRALDLPMSFADGLNPFVQDKFRELSNAVRENPKA